MLCIIFLLVFSCGALSKVELFDRGYLLAIRITALLFFSDDSRIGWLQSGVYALCSLGVSVGYIIEQCHQAGSVLAQ